MVPVNLLDAWKEWTRRGPADVQDDIDFLRESSVFSGLPSYHYPALQELFHESRYRPGERIFTEGDPSSALYLVKQGEVEIVQERPDDEEQEDAVLETLGEGDLFGELALCVEARRTASARAAAETTLLSIFRQELQEFAMREPRCGVQILTNLLSLVGQRLVDTNHRILEGPDENGSPPP